MNFDKIVNKLNKNNKSILDIYDLGELFDVEYPDVSQSVQTKVYKGISRLKDLRIITPIRNGLYVVGDYQKDIDILVDRQYWKLVKKLISRHVGYRYFIAGHKSLEIHQKNYEVPEVLIVFNPDIKKVIHLSKNRMIVFQPLKSKAGNHLFHHGHQYSIQVVIEDTGFRVCCSEQALLESLTKRRGEPDFDIYVIERYLRRYEKHLRSEVLHSLVEKRYITAINRLRDLSKTSGYDRLYAICLDVIKRSGKGCFVSVKL